MEVVRANWITGLAVIVGAFQLFLGVAIGLDDAGSTDAERVFGLVAMGVPGLLLFGGLWGLRSGRLSTTVSYVAVVIGLASTLPFFWMVVPLIAALVVLWFGVIRQGLARELATPRPVSG